MVKKDWDAQYYKQNSQLQYSLAHALVHSYPFTGNEKVLDIGCGEGKITVEIAQKVPHGYVLGIDKSPSMIELAHQLYPSTQYPQIAFDVQDAAHITMQDSFDLISSFSALHWVKDKQAVFSSIRRLIKPTGKVLILTYTRAGTFWEPIEAVADAKQWKSYFKIDPRPYDFRDEKQFRVLLETVGLEPLEIKAQSHIARFKGKKGFENYVKGWLPHLHILPPSLHERFMDEIGTASLKWAPEQADGFVNHPYETLVILAKVK